MTTTATEVMPHLTFNLAKSLFVLRFQTTYSECLSNHIQMVVTLERIDRKSSFHWRQLSNNLSHDIPCYLKFQS
jgi:hypothetical protein